MKSLFAVATFSFWDALSWILPICVAYAMYEGISMIIKAGKSREKEERGGETFWGFVVAGAPIIIYGFLLKFSPVSIPLLSGSLPF